MKLIQTLIICNIAFISACSDSGSGSASDSPTGNVSTPTGNVATPAIDGPKQVLLSDDDGFISTESDDLRLQDIVAPITQKFTAAKQQELTITSQSGDACHINIYTKYNKVSGHKFSPAIGSRVLQMYSENCAYSGSIYLLSQQRKLLIEVINLNLEDTTSYYEETIQNTAIEVAIR
ncbi:hypothetical protein AKG98_383 [Moritella sp. JT01]|uniref:hypothetical protein n=1 Tax=Moritella sp. JT01 TaxID=756698 RepID=UPI0007939F50|nr:hypothetical protein [Moritella sp. JT01]KXO14305.1 hypothetical protein AKG98_383 [Moritella sp. JT01]